VHPAISRLSLELSIRIPRHQRSVSQLRLNEGRPDDRRGLPESMRPCLVSLRLFHHVRDALSAKRLLDGLLWGCHRRSLRGARRQSMIPAPVTCLYSIGGSVPSAAGPPFSVHFFLFDFRVVDVKAGPRKPSQTGNSSQFTAWFRPCLEPTVVTRHDRAGTKCRPRSPAGMSDRRRLGFPLPRRQPPHRRLRTFSRVNGSTRAGELCRPSNVALRRRGTANSVVVARMGQNYFVRVLS